MVQEPLAGRRQKCEVCGADIPEVRLKVVPNVRTCATCQRKLEKEPGGVHLNLPGASQATVTQRSDPEAHDTLQVEGPSGKKEEAQALVQALPAEAQAALVATGEDPEEMLSLTGADESGGPATAYRWWTCCRRRCCLD